MEKVWLTDGNLPRTSLLIYKNYINTANWFGLRTHIDLELDGDGDGDGEALTLPYAEADAERCEEQAENRDGDG